MSPYASAAVAPESGVHVAPIRTILLATDLTAASREATERAIELAGRLEARLLIVNVLEQRRLSGAAPMSASTRRGANVSRCW